MKMHNHLPLLLLVAGMLALSSCDTLDNRLNASFFFGSWTVTDIRDSGGSVWPDLANEVGGANMEFQSDGDLIFAFNEPSTTDTTVFSHEANYQIVAFTDNMIITSNIDGTPVGYVFQAAIETDDIVQLEANSEAAQLINLFLSRANTGIQLSGDVTISIQRDETE